MKVRIATRGSDLALWQANHVARKLESTGVETELVVLKTRGDLIDDVPLHQIEGKAFFTSEIEAALLDGRADLAVHSHKDLPTELTPELTIAAVPRRGPTPERLLVRRAAHLAAAPLLPLKHGARVGTSSPRRAQQLLALRPDLQVIDLRGNVPTRIDRLRKEGYDAIVLAAAGIDRLELDTSDLMDVTLDIGELVPAPAQGALALQTRADDDATRKLCERVFHHANTALAIAAERSLLAAAGGGCSLPLGAAVEQLGDAWSAHIFLGADYPEPGPAARWATGSGATPQDAVDGAYAAITSGAPTHAGPLAHLRVALCGSAERDTRLGERLSALGADVRHERVIAFEDIANPRLDELLQGLAAGDVLAVTSRQTVRRLGALALPAGVRVAAVGSATARELERAGRTPDLVGSGGGRELAEELEVPPGARVLFPCAEQAHDEFERALSDRGIAVERVVLYRTVPLGDPTLSSDVDVRVFMSPSSVSAMLEHERAQPRHGTVRIALGRQTAEELARCGLDAVAPAELAPQPLPLLEHVVQYLSCMPLKQESAQ